VPFADTLASRLLAAYDGGRTPALADVTVWLPNRRAVLAFQAAFARAAKGTTLLPRLLPLSLAGEEDLLFAPSDDLPDAVPDLARLHAVSRQVQAWHRALHGTELPIEPAAESAAGLLALADRLTTAGVPFDALLALSPGDVAEHWQSNVQFLKIVLEHYPAWLDGRADKATLDRTRLLLQAESYRTRGSAAPVLAAGFADTTPAGVEVLKAIVGLPNGHLVLPGFDAQATPPDPFHPQYALHRLVAAVGATPADVVPLCPAPPRALVWGQVLAPAAEVERWRSVAVGPEALTGLTRLEAQTPAAEADLIALLLRETLETPGKTCALVTPDRGLAARVSARLLQWGVQVNDSAGQPLGSTPAGGFFQLVLRVVAERFRPRAVVELIRHPFARFGLTPGDWKRHADALERAVRGPRPLPGPEGLRARVAEHPTPELASAALEAVIDALTPLAALRTAGPGAWLTAHRTAAQKVAATPDGEAPFLDDADGEALEALTQQWHLVADSFATPLDVATYAAWLNVLYGRSPAVRRVVGRHPRVFVWGPLEARLQGVDRVVLGGLNEGTWPKDPPPDPWLSRDMAATLGLPPDTLPLGLSAHDFASLASLPEVFLTRPLRDGGAETVPSRFWVRLNAFLKVQGLGQVDTATAAHWQALAQGAPPPSQATPPAQVPLRLADLPKEWSATYVRDLLQCPYKAYLSKVVGLADPDALEEEPDAADRGTLLHTILQAFVVSQPNLPPAWGAPLTPANVRDATDRLLQIGQAVFATQVRQPSARAVWWPRFERIARAVVHELANDAAAGRTVQAVEVKGKALLAAGITLAARADRIDTTAEGARVLVDYKTGQPPSRAKILSGDEPQLGVEAALALKGGFGPGGAPAEVAIWRLSGGDAPVTRLQIEATVLAADAADGLAHLAEHLQTETLHMAVPNLKGACRHCAFGGICRRAEWHARDGGDE
jgi:ATP-dependent helicase/nuclease subunit B